MKNKYILAVFALLIFRAGYSQIQVGTYTGITHLSNITSVCDPQVNAVLGDTAFYSNSGVEIVVGTVFTGTWANGLAYTDGPGNEILCVSVHTEEWWDVQLLLSNNTFTSAINADMITIADYINLDFLDCSGLWYYNYSYDRRVKELDFASYSIPAGLTVIGARFTLTGDNAANPDPIGMLLIHGNTNPTNPTASNNGPICAGDTLKLTVTHIDSATYSWIGPASFTSTQENPVIVNATLANAGTYTCYVTDSLGDVDTATTTVIINPNPLATFSLPQLCETVGGSFSVTLPNDTLTSYHWDFGTPAANDTSNIANPSFTYGTAGTYTVTLQLTSDEGCKGSIDTTITIDAKPVPTATNGGPYCEGETIQLNATGGNTYGWTGPQSFSSTLQNPAISNSIQANTGVYTVTATSVNGCSASTTTSVGVYLHPTSVPLFDPQNPTNLSPDVHFFNTSYSNIVSYQWNIGGTSYTTSDFTYTFPAPGTYASYLVVTNQWGCVDTTEFSVTVEQETTIYIPNSFTPNGDERNEVFKVYGENWTRMELIIFDRWGRELFYSTDPLKGWNGLVNNTGEKIMNGTYPYKVYIIDMNGKEHTLMGHVNLIR